MPVLEFNDVGGWGCCGLAGAQQAIHLYRACRAHALA